MKVIHLGESFLDCPFSSMKAQDSASRRRDTRETFMRVMRYIADEKIDLALLSGNIVDNHYVTLDTVDFLIQAFNTAPNCQFVITPGCYDSVTEIGLYSSPTLPKNVYVFKKPELTRYSISSLNTSIYGWAYVDGKTIQNPLREDVVRDESTRFNFVCGYGSEMEEEEIAQVSLNEIGDFGCDYVALSGGNLFDGFHPVNQTIYAYSGALEHSGYEEPGFGGVNVITIMQDELTGKNAIETTRVNFGCKRYVIEEFDISDATSPNEVLNRITSVVSQKGYGRETALKVVLVGKAPVGFAIPKTLTNENFGVYIFDLEDRTLPNLSDSQVARDMTIRGELCRTLVPGIKVENPQEQQKAAYALKVGLGALDGRDLTKL